MTDDPHLPEPTATCPHCEGVGKVFEDHKAVGAEMRRRREAKGMDKTMMAAILGISVIYLEHLEAGRRGWTPSRVRRYWAALEVAAMTE